jgi:hypothetical protein
LRRPASHRALAPHAFAAMAAVMAGSVFLPVHAAFIALFHSRSRG